MNDEKVVLVFSAIRLALIDSDHNVRDIVRQILHEMGFRNLILGETIKDIHMALEDEVPPEMIICDVVLPDGEATEAIRAIRHQELGENPFIAVIAMALEPVQPLVKRVIDSGADDLLIKPISAGQLQDRIISLITNRKPFVVTSDYIGPDRRKKARAEPSKVPLINLPNVLAAKAAGKLNVNQLKSEQLGMIGEVNMQKLERDAFHIAFMTDRIAKSYGSGGENPAADKITDGDGLPAIENLLATAKDLGRRLVGTDYEHISDLCRSLIGVATEIKAAGGEPTAKDVELLTPLALAIQVAFTNADESAETVREISRSVSGGKKT